jgi:hypothetical protein
MYLLGKPLNQVNAKDILELIENEVPENATLEYKRDLLLDGDKTKAREEFLCDLTAMANAAGGCIIFGIEEKRDEKNHNTGIPGRLFKSAQNFDTLQQSIHQAILHGTNPPVTSIQVHQLEVEGTPVLIIGVPKRLGLPSMVTFNDNRKIYRRNSSGKYVPDVYELEQIFLNHSTARQAAENFRQLRIDEVLKSKPSPVLLKEGSCFIHAVPMSHRQPHPLPIAEVANLDRDKITCPLFIHTRMNRPHKKADFEFNSEGFISSSTTGPSDFIYAYNQYFRNGIIEFYTTEFTVKKGFSNQVSENWLLGSALANGVCKAVDQATTAWRQFDIYPEFLILVSLRIPFDKTALGGINNIREGEFKKNVIDLPAIAFSGREFTIGQTYETFKPNLDILWQTAGRPAAPTVDQFFHRSSLV